MAGVYVGPSIQKESDYTLILVLRSYPQRPRLILQVRAGGKKVHEKFDGGKGTLGIQIDWGLIPPALFLSVMATQGCAQCGKRQSL